MSLDVARVWVDVPLPHLDRDFDYAVPEGLIDLAVPGARVRVRFAGRLVDGFVVARTDHSDHVGTLAPLVKVVSAEPVLHPEIAELIRAVAERYAGTKSDVIRTAIPPRAARIEAAARTAEAAGEVLSRPTRPDASHWSEYSGASGLLDRIASGTPARAGVNVLPGDDWPRMLAELVVTAMSGDHGALVVLPDATDVARVGAVLSQLVPGQFEVLSAGLGPAARYRAFLRISRGQVKVVIGTRAAAFAPVADLGLLVLWDDGDDLHSEPHAPYWHAREVLSLRAHQTGMSLVFASHGRTAEVQRLVTTGWLRSVSVSREVLRSRGPRVAVASEADVATAGRIPRTAWRAIRDGLRAGPVLVQVPRRGYLPAVACRECRTLARCGQCAGPLQLATGHAIATCTWCGRIAGDWNCSECGRGQLRAVSVGSSRTAEELGRAFPGTQVINSAGTEVKAEVGSESALVIATPGAEPVALSGYAAAVLLDAGVLLARPDLRAGEEALRRWLNAAALVRSGGAVVLAGADAANRAVQALVRLDPIGFSERELAERSELGLPPAARVALIRGAALAVTDLLDQCNLPASARVLGPVPDLGVRLTEVIDPVRVMIGAPVADGAQLAAALKAAMALRSARKSGPGVETRLDPIVLG